MSVLHMDTDACYAVKGQIVNSKEAINDSMIQINSQVSSMVGSTWIAPGAEQFKGEIEQWVSQVQQALENLQTLADRLQNEVQNWTGEGQSF